MKLHLASVIFCVFPAIINLSCKKESHKPNIVVYGHAGTSLYSERWVYPANTIESVIYALDILDADGVEVDVQMTKDSVLVLYHDAFLDGVTNLSGCVSDYNFNQIENTTVYATNFKIAQLKDVLRICQERNKKLFLDIKPYNYCSEMEIDYATFNNALNDVLSLYTTAEKMNVTLNTRTPELIAHITDTVIIKSFETEDVDLGIYYVDQNLVNQLCLSFSAMTEDVESTLKNQGIEFSIFSVKTQREIEQAVVYQPVGIVTDNIAFTKKITQ